MAEFDRSVLVLGAQDVLPDGSYGNRYPEALQYDGMSMSPTA